MEKHEKNEEDFLKVTPAAVFVKSITTIRSEFAEVMNEIEDINEIPPINIMRIIVSLANVFNSGIRAADASEQDTNDAEIYMSATFCHHEGLISVIRDYEPDESRFVADKEDSEAYELLKDIKPHIIKFFDTCHDNYHREKLIDISFYEKELKQLNMEFARHKDLSLHISGGGFHYSNVTKEDIEAIMQMAAEMDMPDLHDWEVAEAAASHINNLLEEGKSVKDLDTFDIMNQCLGCRIIDMKNGEDELRDFISDCVSRDKEMDSGEKYKKNPDDRVGTLFAKVPAYKLPDNRMLVFEPSRIETSLSPKEAEAFKNHMNKQVIGGLFKILELTPKELVPASVSEFLNGNAIRLEHPKEMYKDLISWLAPWAGRPSNFPDGFKAAGITDAKALENVDLGVWENSCIYQAIEKYLANNDHIDIPLGMATVLGIMHNEGPHGLIEQIVNDKVSPVDGVKALSVFREDAEQHGYEIELLTEEQVFRIRNQSKKEN